MIIMILCWVLYNQGIIGLALPIISTIFFALELTCGGIKVGLKVNQD